MKTLSMLLIVLLSSSSAGSAAQQAPDLGTHQVQAAETPQVAKIKSLVQMRGTGETSKVRVTLGNGTMVRGYISGINDSSFDVKGSKTGPATSISYADVQKIQGPGLSKGAKIGIVVAVAVAAVAVIAAVVWHKAMNELKGPI